MRERNALVVGINYPGTSMALRGCVRDANDWADVLTERGYTVRRLLDADATRANILAGLLWITDHTGYLGRGVFTFSGHGTVVPDRDGDEADALDEAIVPVDYARSGIITDDDLHTVLSHRKFGARLLTISDSCYSGTLMRNLAAMTDPQQPGPTARFMPPEMVLDRRQYVAAARLAGPDQRVVGKGISRNNGVLLSGCDEDEVSYDAFISGAYRGAMTFHAIAALKALPPGATYAQWHAAIRDPRVGLPSKTYPQSPQLQADWHQRHWHALA